MSSMTNQSPAPLFPGASASTSSSMEGENRFIKKIKESPILPLGKCYFSMLKVHWHSWLSRVQQQPVLFISIISNSLLPSSYFGISRDRRISRLQGHTGQSWRSKVELLPHSHASCRPGLCRRRSRLTGALLTRRASLQQGRPRQERRPRVEE